MPHVVRVRGTVCEEHCVELGRLGLAGQILVEADVQDTVRFGPGKPPCVLLAAGKLVGPRLFASGEPHLGERTASAVIGVVIPEPQRDVAGHRVPGHQPRILEYNGDLLGDPVVIVFVTKSSFASS
jgi:hypothetical protein